MHVKMLCPMSLFNMVSKEKLRESKFSNPLKELSLIVFFTYGYSLKLWDEAGIISRETKYFNELAKYFKAIHLLTYGGLDELKYMEYLNNIKVLFNCFHFPSLLYSLLAPIVYRNIFKNASIYRTLQVWGSWTALIAKLIYRKKLIIRQGYQHSLFLKKQDTSLLLRFFIRLLELLSYHLADEVIVTSFKDKEYIIKKYRINPNKIIVIPNYVDIELFKPLNNLHKETNRIVFVGRLDPQKNLFSLLDAVKGLDFRLTLIGDGPLKGELKEKVKKERIDNVEFLGVIPNENLPYELNKSELFVLPSLYEGNPKALLEAMACGLPVIGTNVEGIRELVKHGENGYLCNVDSNSIRNAITTLIRDEELKRKLSLNARKFVKEAFSLEKIIEKELKVYLKFLE